MPKIDTITVELKVPDIVNTVLDALNDEDIVEVVRCKECEHRDGEDGQCPLQSTGDPYLDTYPQNDFYCADGERRDDAIKTR